MLQAATTLLFSTIAILAISMIVAMLNAEWIAIRNALGLVPAAAPQPLPPRYRALPARRTTVMSVRGAGELCAAA